jgi:serine/threonine protein kinase
VSQQTTAVVEMLAAKCNDLQVENERLKKKVEHQRTSRRGNQKNKIVVDLSNVEVQERLAAIGGSLASVYAVYIDGWQCAMKEVFIENPEDAVAVENEIALVEELPSHPNIVRCVLFLCRCLLRERAPAKCPLRMRVSLTHGRYFFHQKTDRHLRLFMTKYAGTLSNFIEKKRESGGMFTPKQIQRFCLDIAKGLQFLHQHKIIHRGMTVPGSLRCL